MFKLVVRKGTLPQSHYSLREGDTLIGSSPQADISLTGSDINWEHCRIIVKNGEISIAKSDPIALLKVDGNGFSGKRRLAVGNAIQIGATYEMLLCADEVQGTPTPQPPDAAEDTPTMVGAAINFEQLRLGAARMSRKDKDQGTQGDSATQSNSAAPASDQTQFMHTRFATPEELAKIREDTAAKGKRRMAVMLIALLALGVLAVLLWPSAPPPELDVRWPVNSEGQDLMVSVPSPLGGVKESGFDLLIPAGTEPVVTRNSQEVMVTTHIGRDRDIPLHIAFTVDTTPNFVTLGREAALELWMKQKRNSAESWNFGSPAPLAFIGSGGGIPYLSFSHRRQFEGQAWCGRILFFRCGEKVITHRAEVPETELPRCTWILSLSMLRTAPEQCATYWEPSGMTNSGNPELLLQRARGEFRKVSPGAWASVLHDLTLALSKDPANPKLRDDAYEIMRGVRQMQNDWFNAQKLKYFNAKANGRKEELGGILAVSRAVFNDPNDYRYYIVRNPRW